jgi:LPS sulfotransferase NodH
LDDFLICPGEWFDDMPPVTSLLDVGRECRLGAFLSGRADKTHLVVPAELIAVLRAQNPAGTWTSATDLAAIPASARWLFVHHPNQEAALIRQAQAAAPQGVKVRGLLQDVLPTLVAAGRFDPTPWQQLPEPQQCYAVVCLPRTGSTFLCELLESAGLGAPKEHLRPPLLHVLRSGQVDEAAIAQILLRHGTVEGIFGTKLISEFLASLPTPPAQRLLCMAQHGFRFIHLQRDLLSQAVSKYLAGHSGVWHQRGQVNPGAIERLAAVPYDFEQLHHRYRQAEHDQIWMQNALQLLPDAAVLPVHYDELVRSPSDVLSSCRKFLGVPEEQAVRKPAAPLPQRLASALPQVQALQERFSRELEERMQVRAAQQRGSPTHP